jgi:hypothetical protein
MEQFESRVSQSFVEDMRTLLNLSPQELDDVANRLAKAPPQFLWRKEVRKLLEGAVSTTEKPDEIGRIVTGLAFLAVSYVRGPSQLKVDIKRGLMDRGLCEAEALQRLMRFLDLVLESKALFLSAKATSLSSEFEQVYSESGIFTDVRPVFENETAGQLLGHFLVHNLKLVVETSQGDRELFVALRDEDLESLGKDIERACLKAKQLQARLGGDVLGTTVKRDKV